MSGERVMGSPRMEGRRRQSVRGRRVGWKRETGGRDGLGWERSRHVILAVAGYRVQVRYLGAAVCASRDLPRKLDGGRSRIQQERPMSQ